ncbi:maleylpyruvate isomerase family mycothiol-dependent enzyme [Nonomuraea deserti]|uniref:Maleylpyruvate isomerase family mycothiol-dependent enzyme n=2 Tax=Nonomuraea deserti TaxID=1848322 RepID=A0A4R4VCC1_9ACTN|nr:maleylpyruvate isomerase family mycothiol-dependent enzyme [Nonomuraea deserti]
MDLGTELFLRTVDSLDDAQLSEPSALPGWNRRHVVAHVHGNAEALRRLVSWAATGVERRMYAGARQRAEEIESISALPAGTLRDLVGQSARDLAADMDRLPEQAWNTLVVTARGRTIPAAEIVWMRTREVTVHAVDLAHGVGFADLPEEINVALIADALDTHARRSGDAAAGLAAWLTGRNAEPPALGPWL